jgi:hypothetical protein
LKIDQHRELAKLMKMHYSPNDKRNAITKAFEEEKYKTFVHDEASFEAIAKGIWSSAEEDSSFRGGYRRYGASKLFLIMMMHELQRRLDREAALKNICVLGVDPGPMISGLQRLSPWVIQVLIYKVIYPILVYFYPNGPIRPTRRSASDVLEAAFGSGSGELPKDLYFDGTRPLETSAESRDVQKRNLVWTETAKYALLKEGDTILGD